MRQTLLLLVIAMLAAGCAKKPAPASAKPPPAEESKDAAPEGAGDEDADSAPRSTTSDPCEGGENMRKQ